MINSEDSSRGFRYYKVSFIVGTTWHCFISIVL